MARGLPTTEDAGRILAAKRTRPPRRPPPSAGNILARTVRSLEGRFKDDAGGLQARWTEIVGAALAKRTEPGRLIRSRLKPGAVLELRVDGPVATLIQHQAPEIIAQVNLFLGAGAVTGLRIVQGPLRHPSAARAGLARPSRRVATPLDSALEAKLADSLSNMPDGDLKAALTRLGREVLRRS